MLQLIITGLSLSAIAVAQCTQWQLVEAASRYSTAQSSGNIDGLKQLFQDGNIQYSENGKSANISTGILTNALTIDNKRVQYDYPGCAAWTELIVTNAKAPYVIGTQLNVKLENGAITKIDTLVTKPGDWLFNATGYLYWAKKENWSDIPKAKQDTRDTLKKAADSYLDLFGDSKVVVPWGTPCARLEGGMYTGKGLSNDTCNVGVPSGIKMKNRRYVIDEVYGTVDVRLDFGGKSGDWPDSHEFRIEGGKIRYVHTMTVCGGVPNCGFNSTSRD